MFSSIFNNLLNFAFNTPFNEWQLLFIVFGLSILVAWIAGISWYDTYYAYGIGIKINYVAFIISWLGFLWVTVLLVIFAIYEKNDNFEKVSQNLFLESGHYIISLLIIGCLISLPLCLPIILSRISRSYYHYYDFETFFEDFHYTDTHTFPSVWKDSIRNMTGTFDISCGWFIIISLIIVVPWFMIIMGGALAEVLIKLSGYVVHLISMKIEEKRRE